MDRFVKTVPPSEQALTGSGIETWVDKITKQRMVKLNGNTMKLSVAIRCGFITPAAY